MNDQQRALLRAVCDTVYPRIEREDDPDGFFARSATDMGLPEAVEDLIAQIPDDTIRGGLEQLLDVLGGQGFLRMPSQLSREQLLRNVSLASPDGHTDASTSGTCGCKFAWLTTSARANAHARACTFLP